MFQKKSMVCRIGITSLLSPWAIKRVVYALVFKTKSTNKMAYRPSFAACFIPVAIASYFIFFFNIMYGLQISTAFRTIAVPAVEFMHAITSLFQRGEIALICFFDRQLNAKLFLIIQIFELSKQRHIEKFFVSRPPVVTFFPEIPNAII